MSNGKWSWKKPHLNVWFWLLVAAFIAFLVANNWDKIKAIFGR